MTSPFSPPLVDIAYDVRTDTPPGKDPDRFSKTLRRYHWLLWNKPLPNGDFLFAPGATDRELRYTLGDSEFSLAPDCMHNTFRHWKRLLPITQLVPETDADVNDRMSFTIGNSIIFPGHRIDGNSTINGARGLHHQIRDRFDLTLECIRRHYLHEPHPLERTLGAYQSFFQRFVSFRGYVCFFLLDDLVDTNDQVRFLLPWSGFDEPPVPTSVEGYKSYYLGLLTVISARNARIASQQQSLQREEPDRSERQPPAVDIR